MNLDKLDDWLVARFGNVAAGIVEGWILGLGLFLMAIVLGFRPA